MERTCQKSTSPDKVKAKSVRDNLELVKKSWKQLLIGFKWAALLIISGIFITRFSITSKNLVIMEKRREYTSSELGTINTNKITTTNGKTLHLHDVLLHQQLEMVGFQLEVAVKNELGRLPKKRGKSWVLLYFFWENVTCTCQKIRTHFSKVTS